MFQWIYCRCLSNNDWLCEMLGNFVFLYIVKLFSFYFPYLSPLLASELSEGLYKQIHSIWKYFLLFKCSNCTFRLDFKTSVNFKAAHEWVAAGDEVYLYAVLATNPSWRRSIDGAESPHTQHNTSIVLFVDK